MEQNRACAGVSIHATLAGGDSSRQFCRRCAYRFYPRHPRGWRPCPSRLGSRRCHVSIHATLAGGDENQPTAALETGMFLSTPPSRVATVSFPFGAQPIHVSIHATLAGGDGQRDLRAARRGYVSIHATLAGGDSHRPGGFRRGSCFYPRHPRGWRHCGQLSARQIVDVSIHATLAGGDLGGLREKLPDTEFLSTPPSRVATSARSQSINAEMFLSTPPSRVATSPTFSRSSLTLCFYPRHPRGWRRLPPASSFPAGSVSIHATLAGGDDFSERDRTDVWSFYPRHPRGWRQVKAQQEERKALVSIHATLAGGDRPSSTAVPYSCVSIHATLAGGD